MSTEEHFAIEITALELDQLDQVTVCARMMSSSEPWITLRRSYDDSIETLTVPTKEVYLATVKDQIVGFVILNMQGASIGYIQTICVAPAWRNKEIGSRLLAFAEERILGETPNVFMCVSSFNQDAQRLYRRLGYQVVGELEDYIVPGHSEILLRKTVSSLKEFSRK